MLNNSSGLRLFRWEEIYGLYVYSSWVSASFKRVTKKPPGDPKEIRWIYGFKRWGKDAEAVEAVVRAVAAHFKCEAIVAVPGSGTEPSQLQRLFGETIKRAKEVMARKHNHTMELGAEFEKTYAVDGAALLGRKVLLVDDVCTTGGTLRHFAGALGRAGAASVVCFALGLDYKLTIQVADVVKPPAPPPPGTDAYEARKERQRDLQSKMSRTGRDIGAIPNVADPTRRARAAGDFRFFCETYFPEIFRLPWSPDHLKVIAKAQEAVLKGGLFALAMPRGSGKSSLAESACLWAALNGLRDFICLIGASAIHAQEMLESLRAELESNDLLEADFPEVCIPIRRLEGIANRCSGQLCNGERTRIGWTQVEVVLPSVRLQLWAADPAHKDFLRPDGHSRASGAIIRVTGITGRIRGMKFKRSDGEAVRPSLVILDDPQTDESAHSLSQCAARERILAGAVLGLAGPGKKISGIMPCTVISPGDMADKILDRDKHPDWNGERTKMVYAFPSEEKLWARYAEVRGESLRKFGDLREATEFYRANREAMDAGVGVAWPERFNHDELSAIQHAMNLKLQDEAAFFAEYQNEPLPQKGVEDEGLLSADQIAAKLNGHPRGAVPIGVSHLTMFVDVQGKLLFWVVCGWQDDFTGYVLDYGAYPDQRRAYFTLRDAQRTLQTVAKGAGLEGAIYAGLEALTGDLLGREWRREDGAMMRVGLCLVDANWGTSTDVVYQFCRQSQHSVVLLPCHGRFVGASSRPFQEYGRRPGDRVGLNWRIPNVRGRRVIRHALFDSNYWKSFVHTRLAGAMGDKGCLSIFGRDPEAHRLLAEHLTAEYRVRTEGRGRVVDEWKLRPEVQDNHWLDGIVGSAVAASILGAVVPGTSATPRPRERIRLSDLQARRTR